MERASAYIRNGANLEELQNCDDNLLTVFATIDPFFGLDLHDDEEQAKNYEAEAMIETIVDQDLPPSKV